MHQSAEGKKRLVCEVRANPCVVDFTWMLDNVTLTRDDHDIQLNDVKSVLTLDTAAYPITGVVYCYVNNSVGLSTPCQISVEGIRIPTFLLRCYSLVDWSFQFSHQESLTTLCINFAFNFALYQVNLEINFGSRFRSRLGSRLGVVICNFGSQFGNQFKSGLGSRLPSRLHEIYLVLFVL